jgi:hypothetical protein
MACTLLVKANLRSRSAVGLVPKESSAELVTGIKWYRPESVVRTNL